MANLFKQVGIYSSVGQRYAPEDIGSVLSYREAMDGQILEEGISEAGAIASWTAAATSYSVHGLAMLPFYIYYSMFGFQRVGDQIWAAADQRPRGFLLGATSGRTTLGGEGLQHQDGTSHLMAATIPNCKAWDPAFSAEMAVIVDRGMREMMVEQQDVFYYITLMNENYAQLDLPVGAEENLLRGAYRLMQLRPQSAAAASSDQATQTSQAGKGAPTLPPSAGPSLTLLGSGAILTEVITAANALVEQGVAVDVISVTSWSQLARDGQACEADETTPFLTRLLNETQGPMVAATDYVRAVPESVRAYVPEGRAYATLGTDGFGRSDTRSALRSFFGVDAASIQAAAHRALTR